MAFHHPKDSHRKARKHWRNKSSLRRVFKAILPELRRIARQHGYAIGTHGSLTRDFDLMAMPWVEAAGEPIELVNAIIARFGGFLDPKDPTEKPHGRKVWCIHLYLRDKFSGYVDLGFMPRHASREARDAAGEAPALPDAVAMLNSSAAVAAFAAVQNEMEVSPC